MAEVYTPPDHVKDISVLYTYTGCRMQEDIAEESFEKFYVEPGEVDADEIKMNPPLREEEKLVIEPLAYIRGRRLVNIFLIVDEAQNLTPHEVKTIITRAGEGSKIVFTGDIFQIDHPYLDSLSNGLSYLIEKMQGQPLYSHINLKKGERSEFSEPASDLL
ncbi:MAG: PhoH family protein [Desulfobulbaceae bacterium]|nr:PhoH family protein [Desulfobulbaceae bacterium]